ncbi:hypothetical protein AXG93_291s1030 [Marchantia polymorpha subsp. ruderalis]|uniref:Uncharacterized protein n=1 Tax=Marchantia polymorpha subsp. ruderalis TaxID=1480154 RepID=A0A176VHI2_MARPO|nr:hypothetical protein AXG93_291s1030 [Marchantia polymorpha subsp. ruderalis]
MRPFKGPAPSHPINGQSAYEEVLESIMHSYVSISINLALRFRGHRYMEKRRRCVMLLRVCSKGSAQNARMQLNRRIRAYMLLRKDGNSSSSAQQNAGTSSSRSTSVDRNEVVVEDESGGLRPQLKAQQQQQKEQQLKASWV